MELTRKHVKSDCEELLSRFQKTDSVRFEVFCKIWREIKFEQIFCGTVKHKSRSFSRLVLDTACTFFLPPFSFQIRVGGLYLLYSLYHCQTATSPPEQIRLALKDWDEVQKFEKDAATAQHFDATFILRQLMFRQAFHFTAMPTALAFSKKVKPQTSRLCEEFIERASRPQELINTELIQEMSNIHELYEKLKASVAPPSEQADLGINLIQNDLVPKLRNSVLDFYKKQQRMDGTHEEDESGEGTSQGECSRRAELLSSIKSKAYGEAAEASKSRRHRQVEVDVTCNESGPTHMAGASRSIKPSLKARTNEKVHIAGDLLKEAMTSTQINRLTTLESVPEGKKKR